jgi:anhydro-N-acetylmuramic acid kinase
MTARHPILAVGLMSGTSVDGIDAALVSIPAGDPRGVTLQAFVTVPYPAELREEILAVCHRGVGGVDRVCVLNVAIGECFAAAALSVLAAGGVRPEEVGFIASHGQTVWHQPEAVSCGGVAARGTLQLGEPAVIAERTGATVVANFRSRDMAAGGQGAPLVPYVDFLLFGAADVTRAVQNLGGIGNVTFLRAGGAAEEVLAFDTGPGNMTLDAAARRVTQGQQSVDTDGRLARAGQVLPELLAELMADPYLAQPPPKSTGRERYGEPFVAALWDRGFRGPELVATLTAFTAQTVALGYRNWLPGTVDEVILGGGGAHNPALVERLASALAPARLRRHADFGIPDDAKEALAFALLGYETLRDRPANLPSATGACRPLVLGSITPGRSTGV